MKHIYLLFVLLFGFLSCNSEGEKRKSALEEFECKMKLSQEISKNGGDDILVLAVNKGLGSEYQAFLIIQRDSTVSCDSIKRRWELLKKRVLN